MHLFAMQLGMALVGLLFKIIILLVAVGLTLKIYCECTKGKYRGSQGMAGKTVIITGGNSGIGKETAKELARRKARVIIACRNIEKARKAAPEIFEDTEQQVTIKLLDLQSFKSVREFANDIINTEPRLDVLINNAGMTNESRNPDLTEDGCEPCFQANYLGHFLLTVLLA
ncbi:retinol dehydrogenase 13-like, partial [Ixodes scapularis]|uniref:retinol dehydrogenase 13-like n=1 Tax=Ixodes scapularis TaxID=6945 RepID=UPI001A9F60D9